MPEVEADLIYDVGLDTGSDTANYLRRGFRVVAIDANPVTIDRARLRFAAELAGRRLTLLNIGIADTAGVAKFYQSEKADWSSFDLRVASREGTAYRTLDIPTEPLTGILERHGLPFYLKVDIEGNDGICIRAIRDGLRPPYMSVESECVGDAADPSEGEFLANLELLRQAGYGQFKLIRQDGFYAARPPARAFLQRLANSAAFGKLRFPPLSWIGSRYADAAKLGRLGLSLEHGSSGPWAEETPGPWWNYQEARELYRLTRRLHFASPGQAKFSFWYDWHAKV